MNPSEPPPPYDETQKGNIDLSSTEYGQQPSYAPTYPGGAGYPQSTDYPPQSSSQSYQYSGQAPIQQQPLITSQPPVATVVVTNPNVIPVVRSDVPLQMICPYCNQSVCTTLEYDAGGLTWVICAVLCVVGCDAGCCLIPFCIDSCKDVIHKCPSCRRIIGRYNRL